MFYHQLKNLPETFANYFTGNSEIHNYNTRSSSQLHKMYKRTNYAKHTLSQKAVDVWNNLLNEFKNIESYNMFKKCIKVHLLSSED